MSGFSRTRVNKCNDAVVWCCVFYVGQFDAILMSGNSSEPLPKSDVISASPSKITSMWKIIAPHLRRFYL